MTILLQGAGQQQIAPITPPGPTPLLDLEADMLALSDGDPVSTWADQSTNGNDFAQTGAARPTKQTIGGYPAVVLDGVNDLMLGPDFADDLSSFTIFAVGRYTSSAGIFLSKDSSSGAAGWWIKSQNGLYVLAVGGEGYLYITLDKGLPALVVMTFEIVDLSEAHIYINGDRTGESDYSALPVTDFHNTEPVRIGGTGDSIEGYHGGALNAIRIYTPAPNATDRAAIESELAARYGITL